MGNLLLMVALSRKRKRERIAKAKKKYSGQKSSALSAAKSQAEAKANEMYNQATALIDKIMSQKKDASIASLESTSGSFQKKAADLPEQIKELGKQISSAGGVVNETDSKILSRINNEQGYSGLLDRYKSALNAREAAKARRAKLQLLLPKYKNLAAALEQEATNRRQQQAVAAEARAKEQQEAAQALIQKAQEKAALIDQKAKELQQRAKTAAEREAIATAALQAQRKAQEEVRLAEEARRKARVAQQVEQAQQAKAATEPAQGSATLKTVGLLAAAGGAVYLLSS
jgi:DNA repair exonuclease SbcCD ATPase subunit